MRIGIFGRGRLAQAVHEVAGDRVAWLAGRGESPGGSASRDSVTAVLDCSVGEAVEGHLEWALDREIPLVIAATGWHLEDLPSRIGSHIGVVVAPNGSLTVALLTRLARLLGAFGRLSYGDDAGGYLLDHHHAAKVDAPSGTARILADAWRCGAGETPELSVASVRAGHAVGTHVLGLDAPGEQLELVHRARSRAPFAHGLLHAAEWISERRGLFTLEDVAASTLAPLFDSCLGESP